MSGTKNPPEGRYFNRLSKVENIFELRNWWYKHKQEIDLLSPPHRDSLVEAVNTRKVALENKEKEKKEGDRHASPFN